MTQSEEMLKWGGDNWLCRNKKDLGKEDPVWPMLPKDIKSNHHILEIGCSNGWRLKKIKDQFGCKVYGIEPSEAAVAEAKYRNNLLIQRGVANNLPHSWADRFDIVILGFCLWLIEPSEWFKTVSETDRVLKNGGLLIIHDYASPRPFRSQYDFDEELKTHQLWNYFFDWVELWIAHPAYSRIVEQVVRNPAVFEMVSVLRKNMNCLITAEPNNPA